jgi:hypothetical protein
MDGNIWITTKIISLMLLFIVAYSDAKKGTVRELAFKYGSDS